MTIEKYADFTSLSPCFVAPAKQIIFGCHDGPICKRWHGEQYDCHTTCCGYPRECCNKEVCKERIICDEWNTDQDSPTNVNDRVEVHGYGYELDNPKAIVSYLDLPKLSALQGGILSPIPSQVAVNGSLNFELPIKSPPSQCEKY